MLENLDRISIDFKSAFTQKCRSPITFMLSLNIKSGDVVSINCRTCSFICRVFPHPITELKKFIEVVKTVSYNSLLSETFLLSIKRSLLKENFKTVKTTVFEKVRVKLVFHQQNKILSLQNTAYCDIVLKLLRNYVITNNATIKCRGRDFADFFHIHSIVITDTFQYDNIFGRLTRTAVVEISEIVLKEQVNELKKFENTGIGGTTEANKILRFYLLQKASKNIIVLGPSGCGKSVFVKKFCSKLKCSLIIIDCLKNGDLTMAKCDAYSKQLIQASKIFPNRSSILLVDHINEIASINIKQEKKSSVPALIYLFECLRNSRVSIIVVATQRKFIHPTISCLFEDEVFLGIPSFSQRKEMLVALMKSYPNNCIDYDKIAGMTPGFLACDFAQLLPNAITVQKTLQSNFDEVLSTAHFEKALISVTPSLLKTSDWNMKVKPVCWEDIGGMDSIKKRLQLSIERPLQHPEIFQKVDLRCPRGVLLFGPPGCCKTTLARGLATECNANFFAANPSQIYSSYVGESEKNIAQLFYQARLCAPTIIFLDELDSLVGCRAFDTKQQGVAEKILSTLLNEMDGLGVKTIFGESNNTGKALNENFEEKNTTVKKQLQDEVIVVGATNRPDCIDDALLRPGRFDIIVYVPPPNLEERLSILQTVTKNMTLHEVDLRKIAEKTDSYTGADLKNVCSMAARNALRENLVNAEYVTQHNFLQALEKAQPSVRKEQIQMYEQLSNKYGPVISN